MTLIGAVAWGLLVHTHRSLSLVPAEPCQGQRCAEVGVMKIWPIAMHLLAKSLKGSDLTFLICKMGDNPDQLEQ